MLQKKYGFFFFPRKDHLVHGMHPMCCVLIDLFFKVLINFGNTEQGGWITFLFKQGQKYLLSTVKHGNVVEKNPQWQKNTDNSGLQ